MHVKQLAGGHARQAACWRACTSSSILEGMHVKQHTGGHAHQAACWRACTSSSMLEGMHAKQHAGGHARQAACWRACTSSSLPACCGSCMWRKHLCRHARPSEALSSPRAMPHITAGRCRVQGMRMKGQGGKEVLCSHALAASAAAPGANPGPMCGSFPALVPIVTKDGSAIVHTTHPTHTRMHIHARAHIHTHTHTHKRVRTCLAGCGRECLRAAGPKPHRHGHGLPPDGLHAVRGAGVRSLTAQQAKGRGLRRAS